MRRHAILAFLLAVPIQTHGACRDMPGSTIGNYINSRQPSSPLVGAGEDFRQAALGMGFDPRVLMALSEIESQFGVNQCLGDGYVKQNAFGWRNQSTGVCIQMNSWVDGVYTVADGLRRLYFENPSIRSLTELYKQYCITACDLNGLLAIFQGLGGDPNDLLSDCPASCGNGLVEFPEECDGTAAGGRCPNQCVGNCSCGPLYVYKLSDPVVTAVNTTGQPPTSAELADIRVWWRGAARFPVTMTVRQNGLDASLEPLCYTGCRAGWQTCAPKSRSFSSGKLFFEWIDSPIWCIDQAFHRGDAFKMQVELEDSTTPTHLRSSPACFTWDCEPNCQVSSFRFPSTCFCAPGPAGPACVPN